jgi:AraC-like DNA-binding protein
VLREVPRTAPPTPTPFPAYLYALGANPDSEAIDAQLARRLDAGMDFIRQHFREGIGLPDVARAAGYSPFHFHRLFHRHFGRTPKQVITEMQVAESAAPAARRHAAAGGRSARGVRPPIALHVAVQDDHAHHPQPLAARPPRPTRASAAGVDVHSGMITRTFTAQPAAPAGVAGRR